MRAVCAWCQRDGRPGFLGERAPFDSTDETHGICPRHAAQVLAQLPSPSYPDIRMLLVVARDQTRLYDYLAKNFGSLKDVNVIVERRRGDRRARTLDIGLERRRADRRIRRGEDLAFGYTIYRFRPSTRTSTTRPAPSVER